MDPELAAALPMLPRLPFEDLQGTRAVFDAFFEEDAPPLAEDVEVTECTFTASDGSSVAVRLFRPHGGRPVKAAVLDIHGGGFAIGTTRMDDQLNVAIARAVDAVVASVEYRLAPEYPYPTPAQDCYDALCWMWQHAEDLRIDRGRIAVHGDSAGGGLAATVCLWARDLDGPPVAFQSLLEPELDDRCDTESMRAGEEAPVWYRSNAILSWRYYLGDQPADGYAAPARMTDLRGLPPTYVTVNQIDPLLDEGLAYGRRLIAADVPTEIHVWPGAYHGFDMVESAAVSKRAGAALHAALRRGLYGEP